MCVHIWMYSNRVWCMNAFFTEEKHLESREKNSFPSQFDRAIGWKLAGLDLSPYVEEDDNSSTPSGWCFTC